MLRRPDYRKKLLRTLMAAVPGASRKSSKLRYVQYFYFISRQMNYSISVARGLLSCKFLVLIINTKLIFSIVRHIIYQIPAKISKNKSRKRINPSPQEPPAKS